jgi:hypothetical protein
MQKSKPIKAADLLAAHQLREREQQAAAVADAKRIRDTLLAQIAELEQRNETLLSLGRDKRPLSPMWTPRPGRESSKDKRVATAFAALSDVHPGEDVAPETVNGMNAFNPAICSLRLRRWREGAEWLIREQQGMFTVRNLIVWLGGDLMTGYLHEELLESNFLSPIEEVLFIKRELSDALRYLLAHTECAIRVPCNFGNHGRTSLKPRIQSAARNSYEWMMYHMLAQEFSGEPRIQFDIADGELLYTEIYSLVLRSNHGDPIKSNGGTGGVDVPINLAIMRWDQSRKAHVTIVGHHHQFQAGERIVRNGSVIGYNAFAIRIRASYEPPAQAFFLVDSKRGKCQNTPLWVGDKSAEKGLYTPRSRGLK